MFVICSIKLLIYLLTYLLTYLITLFTVHCLKNETVTIQTPISTHCHTRSWQLLGGRGRRVDINTLPNTVGMLRQRLKVLRLWESLNSTGKLLQVLGITSFT